MEKCPMKIFEVYVEILGVLFLGRISNASICSTPKDKGHVTECGELCQEVSVFVENYVSLLKGITSRSSSGGEVEEEEEEMFIGLEEWLHAKREV